MTDLTHIEQIITRALEIEEAEAREQWANAAAYGPARTIALKRADAARRKADTILSLLPKEEGR